MNKLTKNQLKSIIKEVINEEQLLKEYNITKSSRLFQIDSTGRVKINFPHQFKDNLTTQRSSNWSSISNEGDISKIKEKYINKGNDVLDKCWKDLNNVIKDMIKEIDKIK